MTMLGRYAATGKGAAMVAIASALGVPMPASAAPPVAPVAQVYLEEGVGEVDPAATRFEVLSREYAELVETRGEIVEAAALCDGLLGHLKEASRIVREISRTESVPPARRLSAMAEVAEDVLRATFDAIQPDSPEWSNDRENSSETVSPRGGPEPIEAGLETAGGFAGMVVMDADTRTWSIAPLADTLDLVQVETDWNAAANRLTAEIEEANIDIEMLDERVRSCDARTALAAASALRLLETRPDADAAMIGHVADDFARVAGATIEDTRPTPASP